MTDVTDADLDALERRATAGERVVMQVDGETVAALVREVRAARAPKARFCECVRVHGSGGAGYFGLVPLETCRRCNGTGLPPATR